MKDSTYEEEERHVERIYPHSYRAPSVIRIQMSEHHQIHADDSGNVQLKDSTTLIDFLIYIDHS